MRGKRLPCLHTAFLCLTSTCDGYLFHNRHTIAWSVNKSPSQAM
jgi:hypothetical protein